MGKKLKPIREVELEEKNVKKRVILLIVFLLIAFVSIGYGISLLVGTEAGWQTVEANAGDLNYGNELSFQYCFGRGETSASDEYRAVTLVYSQACVDSYNYFSKSGELAKLNAAPNTPVQVSQPLYDALAMIRDTGCRYVFLPVVEAEYHRVFRSESPEEAAQYDPNRDPDQKQWVQELAAFANDPEAVWLELGSDRMVTLRISQDYADFAREYEITEFLDLGWLRNAFVVDYVADMVIEAGYTAGYVASHDGFTRNMDNSGYTLNLFHLRSSAVELAASMDYTGPMNVVVLRSYAMTDADLTTRYTFPDGKLVYDYIDPADGLNKLAVPEFTVYSPQKSCAQIAIAAAPAVIGDSLRSTLLQDLAKEDVWAVWCADTTLCYTQPELAITVKPEAEGVYSTALEQ